MGERRAVRRGRLCWWIVAWCSSTGAIIPTWAGDFATDPSRTLATGRKTGAAPAWDELASAVDDLKTNGTGSISVRSFGAQGNGTTDDTDAVRAAFAATMENGRPANAGRTLVFDRGDYLITDTITVGSGQHVVLRPGTILRAALRDEGTSLFQVIQQSNVTFDGNGASITGNRARARSAVEGNSAAFYVYGSHNVTIRNVVIRDFATDGITLTGDETGAGPCRNVHIEAVVCRNNRRNGLSVISARGVRVVGGEFAESNGAPGGPWAGIDVEPNHDSFVDDVTLVGVNTSGNAGAGIQITPGALSAKAGRRFHLTIHGGRSHRDGAAALGARPAVAALWFVNGGALLHRVPGQVVVRGFLVDEPIGAGVRFRNWDAARSPRVVLDAVSVLDPDATGRAGSDLARAGFAIFAEAKDEAPSLGNIVMRDCSAEDTRDPPRMTWGCVVGAERGRRVSDVRIENPRSTKPASARGANVHTQVSATSILDGVDVVYAVPEPLEGQAGGPLGSKGGQRLVAAPGAVLTLPPADSCRGMHYEIAAGASGGASIEAARGDVIRSTTGARVRALVLGPSGLAILRSEGRARSWSLESWSGLAKER